MLDIHQDHFSARSLLVPEKLAIDCQVILENNPRWHHEFTQRSIHRQSPQVSAAFIRIEEQDEPHFKHETRNHLPLFDAECGAWGNTARPKA